jgi:4-amino-4-deoxy-L-arabinose transferase-like glycosyltransferase
MSTTVTDHPPGAWADQVAAGPDIGAARGGRLTRVWRGRPDDPAWVRPALFGLLVVTAGLYLWDLGASGWANSFYSAAVQAGSKSWKAFFFGSFDSSNFITVDKPAGALWIMDLSARLFGVNSWSLLVPNALEGVAAVGVLYATVRRWASPTAALLAGAVMALTPVAALMFRFDNPDSLLVLTLTAAAYATVRAVEDGRSRWIVMAGGLLGLAFLVKSLQAFLVVPAFALVFLVAAPGPVRRRIWQLLLGGVALVVAAGWWIAAVQLTPAANRPYIGGSQDNSLWNVIFGYNGFGRLTGNESGSVVGGGRTGTAGMWGPTGITRLFGSDMGSQIAWLLPAALILMVATLWWAGRARRDDRTRAGVMLWGGWLLVTAVVFSFSQGIIHPYYTVALSPAIGALVGIGTVEAWRRRDQWLGRAVLSATVAVTAVLAFFLMRRSPDWMPALRGLVIVVGLVSAAGILVWPWMDRWSRRAVAIVAVLACLAGPLAWTLDTVATPHSGSIPSAGPATVGAQFGPGGGGGGGRGRLGFGRFAGRGAGAGAGGFPGGATGGFPGAPGGAGGAFPGGGFGGGTGGFAGPGGSTGASRTGFPGFGRGGGGVGGLLNGSEPDSTLVKYLKDGASGYKWVLAVVGANEASGYQLSTDDAVMAIGGFNGTDPTPTLAQFEAMVASHQVHYFIAGGSFGGGLGGGAGAGGGSSSDSQAITSWVEAHYSASEAGGTEVYNLAAAAHT